MGKNLLGCAHYLLAWQNSIGNRMQLIPLSNNSFMYSKEHVNGWWIRFQKNLNDLGTETELQSHKVVEFWSSYWDPSFSSHNHTELKLNKWTKLPFQVHFKEKQVLAWCLLWLMPNWFLTGLIRLLKSRTIFSCKNKLYVH